MAQDLPKRFLLHIVPPVLGLFLVTAFSSLCQAASYSEQTIYSFCTTASCSDGSFPAAGLIADASGNLYGTSEKGGASSFGAVFKLTPNMNGGYNYSVLYSFGGPDVGGPGADGAYPDTGLAIDSTGNLYGTTIVGGANATGTVFRVAASGAETVLYNFCSVATASPGGCADGAYPSAGLIMGGSGALFGTTANGGSSNITDNSFSPPIVFNANAGTVFQLTPGATTPWAQAVLYNFCSTSGSVNNVPTFCTDGATPFAGLTRDAGGNLYGTTTSGGSNSNAFGGIAAGVAFKLAPGSPYIYSKLHDFCSQIQNDANNNPIACADGYFPNDALLLSGGDLYGTTYYGGVSPTGSNAGTVFRMGTDGSGYSVLYNFCSQSNSTTTCLDGANPTAGLITDGTSLFGTTSFGGAAPSSANGFGTVFQLSLNANPAQSVLYNFTGGADGSDPVAGLVLSGGNLFGTTISGGGGAGGGDGVVFALTQAQTAQLTVSESGAGTGTITSKPVAAINCASGSSNGCSANFTAGSTVTLNPTANAGSFFAGWTDPACSSAGTGPCTLTLAAATNVAGTFSLIPTYTAAISVTGMATVSGTAATGTPRAFSNSCTATGSALTCEWNPPSNTPLTLTAAAAPNSGYVFTGWTGACSSYGVNPTCTVSGANTIGGSTLHVGAGFDPPLASGTACNGTFAGTFNGNVKVSAGENCTLASPCEIKGNVTVNGAHSGASFNLACQVDGNVQLSGATTFKLDGATVGGDLQLHQVTGSNTGNICASQIAGNVQIQNSTSPVTIGGQGCANTVGTNLQVSNNSGVLLIDNNKVASNMQITNNSGGGDVSSNSVGGNLQCQKNTGSFTSAFNSVVGQVQGQCH